MKYGSTLFHLPKRNILISSIISSMVTLLVITMLFMILKVFNLDMMKDHLNQKLVLSVMMMFIWGITFYITHFIKKEMSILRASLRVHFILLLLAHTVALFYIVMQVNMSFIEAMNWIYFYNMQFILSFVVIYAIYILVYNLIGKVFLSMVLTSCTLVILCIVNYLKLIFRGDPLYPSDFTQITHMQSVIPMVMDYFSWSYIFVIILSIVACIVAGIYMRRYIQNVKIHLGIRALLVVGSIFVLYAYGNFANTFMNKVFQKSGVDFVLWNQNENYASNGFILGFISNLDTTVMEKPKNYSKENMLQIANDIKKQYSGNIGSQKKKEKPNIIFVMSESFWDPTKVTNLSFSEDPVPNLHHYIENFPGGQTISPTFGGNTANVEFEALTSYSMSLLKPGSIPYQQVITNKKEIPSIPTALKKEGYYTSAIHSFGRTFFKRDDVYKVLGFDKFNAEDTMKNVDIDGDYISDLAMSKEIIAELEEQKQPTFIHAVTMQNHFPFTEGRFGENLIEISGLENEESKGELETYTEGLRRSDEALQYLIEQLDNLDRPTLLVFFGDHLPSLGTNKSFYKENGYITNEKTPSERLAMAQTPLLMYANFDMPNDNLGLVSPIHFSNLIFDYAGLNKSLFYQFLSELYKEIPVLRDELKVDKNGEVINDLTKKQKEMLEQYKMLQYDLLVGNQYSTDILFK
ncbi:TPA: LTA synthase family protein [Bacillus thuringiensis]|uniref:Phosphoglycerol transferase n=4 Tax=Bacillus cereus group TaxID=86661 RepID=A0A9X6KBJ3_BACTU|nr:MULTISPECIES: LTA synthase family protein [Bacillus]ANN34583.1 phosphoglycerol transferase [Bacillus thuringiensis serovar coreanensis]MDM5372630.1 LTA synthase family protein [Bacillus bombysepticus]NIE90295.1 sulfatase-like hydrolase/transferase [Bacillus sp. Ab-1751]AHZ53622.1 phosphoglycerol transferase [Bacillus thuringiensis serovar kurstaki str. YBT-1520]AIE36050.1 phosphoglycerol transferase [Bacillus thuringiensis serovar kurstaki str. HD-1]